MERRYTIVCIKFPRTRHTGIGEKFPIDPRLRSGIYCNAIRSNVGRRVHHGFSLPAMRTAGICYRAQQFRRQIGVRIGIFFVCFIMHSTVQCDSTQPTHTSNSTDKLITATVVTTNTPIIIIRYDLIQSTTTTKMK